MMALTFFITSPAKSPKSSKRHVYLVHVLPVITPTRMKVVYL